MLDMGFADEIDAICSYLPQPRQTLLFSATFPEGVQNLAQGLDDDAVHVTSPPVKTRRRFGSNGAASMQRTVTRPWSVCLPTLVVSAIWCFVIPRLNAPKSVRDCVARV